MEKAVPTPDTSDVLLRDAMKSDLPIFFDQQLDPDANHMAAFTAKDPSDRDAFMAHWIRILGANTTTIQTKTILFDGQIAGSVLSYEDEDKRLEVSYWIGKPYWGRGDCYQGTLSVSQTHRAASSVCPCCQRQPRLTARLGKMRVRSYWRGERICQRPQ
jgi:hypothetical protein